MMFWNETETSEMSLTLVPYLGLESKQISKRLKSACIYK